jgi:2,3-bisphosphoglycerate-independent phosphoglycerate mutase
MGEDRPKVALLFIDGVGIGHRDPANNPLARHHFLLSQFDDGTGEPLPSGKLFAADTTFGVPGRPQSASNQTAILTGAPAPQLIGRHVLGFPNGELRALLRERSIVRRLSESGRTATFANCYPAGYLDALGLARRPSREPDVTLSPAAARRIRPSATTLAMAAGGVALRTLDDARSGTGLTNDIDGKRARTRGFEVPLRTPEEAAAVFLRISLEHDFTLFEHYLADEAGHARDWERAEESLSAFDRFARAVVASRHSGLEVLICSDHGNVEDLTTRGHTLNRVAVMHFGESRQIEPAPGDVSDVGRLILRLLDVPT